MTIQNGDKIMNITIAQNIKNLREKRGLSQVQLAELLGISDKTVSSWEIGRTEPNMGYVQAMCELFNVNADVLIYGSDERIYFKSGMDYIRIPLYSPICCGDGGFNEDNILEYVPVPSKGLSNPDNYFCQIADGNSMIDAGIDNGDLLVFEKVNRIDTGSIGCFCVDENTAMCKKYTVVNNIVMLMPMNSDYEPVIVDPLDSCFRCIGRLRKVIKDF